MNNIALNNTAKEPGLSKSELIRKSIQEYPGNLNKPNAWEIGKNLFGKYSSGLSNLSTDRKELVKSKIKAKRK
jgi:RHH-type transcriptional regulator, rel operon repressor / antitoxin RelB